MKPVNEKQFRNVVALAAPERFEHFVKVVADWEVAWALWDDGWALMEDDQARQVFPLWPAREYAEAHCTGEWASYEPKEISLPDLLDRLLPQFREKGVLSGIFPTPGGRGVTLPPEQLEAALRDEMAKYE